MTWPCSQGDLHRPRARAFDVRGLVDIRGLVRQISGREGLRGQDRDEEGDQCCAAARPCSDQRLPRVAEAPDHDVGGDEAAEDPRRHGGGDEEALHGPELRVGAALAEDLRPHPDQGQLRDDATDQGREARERQQHVVLMGPVVRELETRHEDYDDHEGPYESLHQTNISHAWLPVDAAPNPHRLHLSQSGCHIASRGPNEAQQQVEEAPKGEGLEYSAQNVEHLPSPRR
mmetsp:Transcript_12884/g.37119  ORF Transcript_12884/g.37119 Transcript_12884/m.37119 type:complete len:230 (-) Transcript_12884:363-1052(-)